MVEIIGRGQGIGLGRELLAKFERRAATGIELLEQRGIIRGVGDNRDMGMVLGRRADHRRPADVDILDDGVALGAAHHGVEERIEVDHDEVDRGDVMRVHRRDMVGIVADREEPAMNLRVERLHPPVHHLREAGQVGDVADLGAELAQPGRGAAGRDDLDPMLRQARGERIEPALVGKRNQRPANRNQVSHRMPFMISWCGGIASRFRRPMPKLRRR